MEAECRREDGASDELLATVNANPVGSVLFAIVVVVGTAGVAVAARSRSTPSTDELMNLQSYTLVN